MPYINADVEVWVDLDDFETEDLIAELKTRRTEKLTSMDHGPSAISIITEIYLAKHVRKQDYSQLVDDLIYAALGKIV